MQKIKFNITNTGTDHPLNSDTLIFIRDIITECGFEILISEKPKKNYINLLPEGFNHFNGKQFNLVKDKFTWGLIRTELYVNNSNKLLNGSFNLWDIYRKISKNKDVNLQFKVLNSVYNFKKKRLIKYLKYRLYNEFIDKKKNYILKKKILFSLLLNKKISISFFIIKFLQLEKLYYDFIKSPHEVNHLNDSKIYKILSLNTHWKDLFMNTYKQINYFNVIFTLGLDEGIPEFKKDKQILLPVINLNKYENKIDDNSANIRKEYDIFFSGLMTEYRKEIYNYLKKYFKVKFVSFIDNDEERLLLNQKSKISIYIKKEKNQSIYSVIRYTYALQNNIPTLFESDDYCVPKYFDSIAYTFKRENMIETFSKILNNYDEFVFNYNNKIKYLKKEFTLEKIENIKNQVNKIEISKIL